MLYKKYFKSRSLFLLYATVSMFALLLFSYQAGYFPSFFANKNLISYEISLTYLAATFFLITIVLAVRNRFEFDKHVANFLIISLIMKFSSLAFFPHAHDDFSISGMGRHVLKFISFFLLYKAVIEVGLTKPYKLLFKKLSEAREKLEDKVKIRTAELEKSNRQLVEEKKRLSDSYRYLGVSNRKMSLLLDIHKAPAGKKHKTDVVWYIMVAAMNYFKADQGFLVRYEGNGNFDVIYSIDKEMKEKTNVVHDIKKSRCKIIEEIIKMKTAAWRNWSEEADDYFGTGGKYRFSIALPLFKENNLIGGIILAFSERKEETSEDTEFIDLFAIHASKALADVNALDGSVRQE